MMGKKIKKSDSEWRRQLTPEQYKITRQKGTKPSGLRYCINSASLDFKKK
jgi:peptide-methionine (R)-S-oxide reductase